MQEIERKKGLGGEKPKTPKNSSSTFDLELEYLVGEEAGWSYERWDTCGYQKKRGGRYGPKNSSAFTTEPPPRGRPSIGVDARLLWS